MSAFWLSHSIWVFAFAAALLMLGSLLRQRRSPQSALAWIGFAIIAPYVVIPAFFLFGWRKLRPAGARVPALAEADQGDISAILASYGFAGPRPGNRLQLCTTGVATYDALIDLIAAAQERIDVEIFILHPDAVGSDILDRLERRAREGIVVRVLLDGVGSLTTWPWRLRRLARAGASIEFFHPLARPRWWLRANLRNHRKIIVVDGRKVLAGGINIATEYMGPRLDPERWTDLAFVVEGPIVSDFQSVVNADWAYATGEASQPPLKEVENVGAATLQLVPSGPDLPGDALQASLLQAIYGARQRISLVTPYFLPDSDVMRALSLAARRGVELELIIPARSNHRFADWARGPYIREIERHGAHVLLYERKMLHAKAVVVDRVAMVGSANLDLRSLFLDYETMMLVLDREAVGEIVAWIRSLRDQTTDSRPTVGRLQEIFEGAIRLLAPLF